MGSLSASYYILFYQTCQQDFSKKRKCAPRDFKLQFIGLFVLHLSLPVERKVPKERHQRAKRPLDTRLACMGLFDRGDTRRGIRKALRISWRRRFPHAPPNSTQGRCAAMVAINPEFAPQNKVVFCQTSYLPAEKRGEFRAVGTLPIVRVFVKLRPIRAISP